MEHEEKPMFDYCLFDLDGTFTDPGKGSQDQYNMPCVILGLRSRT